MNIKTPLKPLFQGMAALTLALGVNVVGAATLSLTSAQTQYSVGDTINVNLNVSGLGDHAASSLGAYDVDMAWSQNFQFLNASFGTGLGSTLFDTINILDMNHLKLAQVSQESVDSLIANQPGEFTLATLSFLVTNDHELGGATIEQHAAILSDENGDALSVNASSAFLRGGSAPPPVTAVPLPATWLLFSAGLAFVEGTRRLSGKRVKA